MNLIKSESNSINRLLIAYKCVNKMTFTSNTRKLFSLQKNPIPSYLSFSSTKSQIFGNFCQNHIKSKLEDRHILCPNHIVFRCLSKGKDRLKEKRKAGKPKVILSDEEISELIPIEELKLELDNVIEKFKTNLITNVSIRSNPQSIENLIIEMDGSKHSLSEVANITRKSPQLVVINLSSLPDAIKPVLTAINESGMNLSPQQEGNVIYLPIPKVTREHREVLAHNAKTLFTKTKDELKHIQSSFSNYVKKQKKSHVSEELIYNVNENLKYLIDSKVNECQQIVDQKIKELLN